MAKDPAYAEFFRKQSDDGKYVIMDNGACETGKSLPIEVLSELADEIQCSEIVLPDELFQASITVHRSYQAYNYLKKRGPVPLNLMVVPQGKTAKEWASCVRVILSFPWEIDTIGISRFVVPKLFSSRILALMAVPELLSSDKAIHLLGCPSSPRGILQTDAMFEGRIRGADSGIAAIYAQAGRSIFDGPKPDQTIDLDAEPSEKLLRNNIAGWKAGCGL